MSKNKDSRKEETSKQFIFLPESERTKSSSSSNSKTPSDCDYDPWSTSEFLIPHAEAIRPSSWDDSDEDCTIKPSMIDTPKTEESSSRSKTASLEIKESDADFPVRKKDGKNPSVDRRQSPARIRRRTKSSSSSSPAPETTQQNASEDESPTREDKRDADEPEENFPELDTSFCLDSFFTELRSKRITLGDLTPKEIQEKANEESEIVENAKADEADGYCRTFRKLSQILEVEELKKDPEEMSLVNLEETPAEDSPLFLRSFRPLVLSPLPTSRRSKAKPFPENRYKGKSISLERLEKTGKLGLPGSLSERQDFFSYDDRGIFLTPKRGKMEITENSAIGGSPIRNKTFENDFEIVNKFLELKKSLTGSTFSVNARKTEESYRSLDESKVSDAEPPVSPKFKICLESARSLKVEDVKSCRSERVSSRKNTKPLNSKSSTVSQQTSSESLSTRGTVSPKANEDKQDSWRIFKDDSNFLLKNLQVESDDSSRSISKEDKETFARQNSGNTSRRSWTESSTNAASNTNSGRSLGSKFVPSLRGFQTETGSYVSPKCPKPSPANSRDSLGSKKFALATSSSSSSETSTNRTPVQIASDEILNTKESTRKTERSTGRSSGSGKPPKPSRSVPRNLENRSSKPSTPGGSVSEESLAQPEKNNSVRSERSLESEGSSSSSGGSAPTETEDRTGRSSAKSVENKAKVEDSGVWENLIGEFDDSRNSCGGFSANNFPGFPFKKNFNEDSSSAVEKVMEVQRDEEGLERTSTKQERKISEEDVGKLKEKLEKKFKTGVDSSDKVEVIKLASPKTFYFDFEERENFGIGEFGDVTCWNMGKLETDKPKDHGDGFHQQDMWEELLPKRQTPYVESKNFLSDQKIVLEDNNLPEVILDGLKISKSDNYITEKESKSKTSGENPAGVPANLEISRKRKRRTKIASKSSPESSESGSTVTLNRRFSNSTPEMNVKLEEKKFRDRRVPAFEEAEDLNIFLAHRQEEVMEPKTNNWLIVGASKGKKGNRKLSKLKTHFGVSKERSWRDERENSGRTPITPLKLRNSGCLRNFYRRIIKVCCLTSDASSTATN